MGELLVIVPTRSRPANLARLVAAIADTRAGSVELVAVVDDDDPTKGQYLEVMAGCGFGWVEVGPRARLGELLNRTTGQYAASYDAVGFMGDDHLPQTLAWDTLVLGALAELGGTGMVYGDDKLQGPALPTAIFVASCLPLALGWLVPPTLEHLYLDSYWLALGRRTGAIRYLPHVTIEHLHPVAGKAPSDALYELGNSSAQYDRDRAAFEAWCMEHLEGDVGRLRENCGRR